MYDKTRKLHITFNASVLPVSTDPRTYDEHLEFATWYQMISSPRRTSGSGGSNREKVMREIREDLAKRSLMELRAIFLFSIFERTAENQKGDTLNVLERVQVWERMERQGMVRYCANRIPAATGDDNGIKYSF
ncbi:hypothetical protein SEA_DRYAD_88 [Streptomyces phage Dryad]|nr:hypothetical protein SEA_DRYAD_88 [Streptomyces phage Dryad]